MALLIGFLLVALLGVFHHACLRGLDRFTGRDVTRPNQTILAIFCGLLAIHTVEILLFAAAYAGLLTWPWMGELGGSFDDTWEGLVYLSGIAFTTLGYTQIEARGPIRLVTMMQALGGFMVLTWSATFIYSVWGRAFREDA